MAKEITRGGLRGWFARRRQAWTAGRRYAYHQHRHAHLLRQLGRTADADERGRLMLALATSTNLLGILHDRVHGMVWIAEEEQSVGMSLVWQAGLWRALADAEFASAHHAVRVRAVGDIERVAGGVLDRISAAPELVDRLRLYPALRAAVTPAVGRVAAAMLTEVPAPAAHLAGEQ